ncbi:MAG: adenine deaminase [Bacteroidota bacterium]|nr:adenine deaminase [Bacteroidota bacterium]
MKNFNIEGNIVDVINQRIFKGYVVVSDGKIVDVVETDVQSDNFILPGLIDAHVHVESSMLVPSEFARIAVTHGTVGTVSDPHEIANVLGADGVRFMIENGKKVPFKFYFGAPSCVPATPFETAGAEINANEIEALLKSDDIYYLAEMMNFPGVLSGDEEVMKKIAAAKKYNKPVDGHAPGVLGADAKKYASAGISTDHECFTQAEAIDKINSGMKVQIREGSAAKNFEELIPLIEKYSDEIMFCSDDKHPDNLAQGHINQLVTRALAKGYDFFKVLKVCTVNPVKHYNLDAGLLQKGDAADCIVVDNLEKFNVIKTFINGELVSENGVTKIESCKVTPINNFCAEKISASDIAVKAETKKINVFKAFDGQLITQSLIEDAKIVDGNIVSDVENDNLKIVVLNRYKKSKPAIGFIKNFELKRGALGSTVAHDSHNIIAVGADDESIVKAVNAVIEQQGGVSCVDGDEKNILPLPVAGIMSNADGYEVGKQYAVIDAKAKSLGSKLNAPFMTLSFMALLVIPEMKLSDKGLFNGNRFEFTSIYIK